MSLSRLFSSIPSVNLNKKVKDKINSVGGVLHFSRDIDVVEIEKVKNQWKITFDNVTVSNLKGGELENVYPNNHGGRVIIFSWFSKL